MMPIIQGFPPFTEGNFTFQDLVEPINHAQQYTVVLVLFIILHFVTFSTMLRRIYRYINKFYRKEEIAYEEIKRVRYDCVSTPYKLFIIHIIIMIVIGILLCIAMEVELFAMIKFILMFFSIISLISIFFLIVTQRLLDEVLETTYTITKEHERNSGIRIELALDLIMQMIPFLLVVLVIIGLIGNAKAVEKKAETSMIYYKVHLEYLDIMQNQVNTQDLKRLLEKIPLLNERDYFYIISPNNEIEYISKPYGEISDYMILYRDFFFEKTEGVIYERPGISEQSYMMKLIDIYGRRVEHWI
jgi:F0F1-type ATP synthase assembly protein I